MVRAGKGHWSQDSWVLLHVPFPTNSWQKCWLLLVVPPQGGALTQTTGVYQVAGQELWVQMRKLRHTVCCMAGRCREEGGGTTCPAQSKGGAELGSKPRSPGYRSPNRSRSPAEARHRNQASGDALPAALRCLNGPCQSHTPLAWKPDGALGHRARLLAPTWGAEGAQHPWYKRCRESRHLLEGWQCLRVWACQADKGHKSLLGAQLPPPPATQGLQPHGTYVTQDHPLILPTCPAPGPCAHLNVPGSVPGHMHTSAGTRLHTRTCTQGGLHASAGMRHPCVHMHPGRDACVCT